MKKTLSKEKTGIFYSLVFHKIEIEFREIYFQYKSFIKLVYPNKARNAPRVLLIHG